MLGKSFALLCVTLVLLVGRSSQIPVHEQTKMLESTTVKILIPPSNSAKDSDSDAVVVQASQDGLSETGADDAKEFDPNDCFLEKSKGPCRAVIDSWFYNTATKNCESFSWSGCGGNNNRFSEKIQCESRCMNKATSIDAEKAASKPIAVNDTAATTSPNGTNSQCPVFDGCGPLKCAVVQEPDTGCMKCACSLAQHDDSNNKRKTNVPESVQVSTDGLVVGQTKLPVGSVSGTPSKLGEEDSSETESDTMEKPEEVCKLPITRGHCRAMMTRWRYNSKIKDCIEFHFGGCDGNSNNFVSKDKCVKYCKGQ